MVAFDSFVAAQLAIPHADYVFVLDKTGAVVESGRAPELLANPTHAPVLHALLGGDGDGSKPRGDSDASMKDTDKADTAAVPTSGGEADKKPGGKPGGSPKHELVKDEDRAAAGVSFEVYKGYMHAAGVLIVATTLTLYPCTNLMIYVQVRIVVSGAGGRPSVETRDRDLTRAATVSSSANIVSPESVAHCVD